MKEQEAVVGVRIEKTKSLAIKAIGSDGGYVITQSVEAHILLKILEKLSDIEQAIAMYKIKPLEWEEGFIANQEKAFYANTFCEEYWVGKNEYGYWWSMQRNIPYFCQQAESLDQAKAAAQAHWEEEIKKALVEVR